MWIPLSFSLKKPFLESCSPQVHSADWPVFNPNATTVILTHYLSTFFSRMFCEYLPIALGFSCISATYDIIFRSASLALLRLLFEQVYVCYCHLVPQSTHNPAYCYSPAANSFSVASTVGWWCRFVFHRPIRCGGHYFRNWSIQRLPLFSRQWHHMILHHVWR